MAAREFDVILYGATGFVGRQTAAYFARHAPPNLRWAIAGRDATKLAALGMDVPMLIAEAADQGQVDAIVARTHVVLTTAGPFKYYGDPFVDACVRLRADYVDISGETVRIRNLIDRYHDRAQTAQVRIVPFCGVSSATADLGVYALDKALDGQLGSATAYLQLGGGSFSGGSIASIADSHETGDIERERDVFLLAPDAARAPHDSERDPRGVRYDRTANAWISPSPMAISDTRAVRRSAALGGRDILFQEYMMFPGVAGWFRARGFNTVLGLLATIMRHRATRDWIRRRLPPGSGPSDRAMDAAWYELRIVGQSISGQTASVVVRGDGDAGNRITVKCVCESALALALCRSDLPPSFGVLTPSVAFGEVLVKRLGPSGVTFTRLAS